MPGSLRAIAILLAVALASAVGPQSAGAAFCSKGLKAKKSETPVTVTFVNKSWEYRGVMWADFSGKLVPYANLNPGEKYTVNTYVTHPWVFADGPGNCVEVFMPKTGVPIFNITAKASGAGGD